MPKLATVLTHALAGLTLLAAVPPAEAACKLQGATGRYLLLGKTGVGDSEICGGWLRCAYPQQPSADQTRCVGVATPVPADKLPDLMAYYATKGWRLPSRRELGLLVEPGHPDVLINHEYFPDSPAGSYWTSEAWELWQSNQPTAFFTVNFSGTQASHTTMTAMSGYYLRFVNIPK